jgi:hypothetical protein
MSDIRQHGLHYLCGCSANKPAFVAWVCPVGCGTERLGVASRKEGEFRIAQVKSLRLYKHEVANIRVMVVTRTHEKRSLMRKVIE